MAQKSLKEGVALRMSVARKKDSLAGKDAMR